jgi:hypothetical protein
MMNKPESNLAPNARPTSIDLDLSELDLKKLASFEGTALHAIVQELSEDANDAGQSKHHSHHSYNTHGTAAW